MAYNVICTVVLYFQAKFYHIKGQAEHEDVSKEQLEAYLIFMFLTELIMHNFYDFFLNWYCKTIPIVIFFFLWVFLFEHAYSIAAFVLVNLAKAVYCYLSEKYKKNHFYEQYMLRQEKNFWQKISEQTTSEMFFIVSSPKPPSSKSIRTASRTNEPLHQSSNGNNLNNANNLNNGNN